MYEENVNLQWKIAGRSASFSILPGAPPTVVASHDVSRPLLPFPPSVAFPRLSFHRKTRVAVEGCCHEERIQHESTAHKSSPTTERGLEASSHTDLLQ